jgi:hypothetical protein
MIEVVSILKPPSQSREEEPLGNSLSDFIRYGTKSSPTIYPSYLFAWRNDSLVIIPMEIPDTAVLGRNNNNNTRCAT